MSSRHMRPPSGGPVRHSVSIAALYAVILHRIGIRVCADACGNWQRGGGVSAFSDCMSCCGVRGSW